MFLRHFAFRDVAELENDVELKLIIFFDLKNADDLVQFSDGFSQPRVKTVLYGVLAPDFNKFFTLRGNDGL